MVVDTYRPPRHVEKPRVPKPDTRKLGYIRWPTLLVECGFVREPVNKDRTTEEQKREYMATLRSLRPGEPKPERPGKIEYKPIPGIDWKLAIYLAHRSGPSGASDLTLDEVKEFLGPDTTKHSITAALERLCKQWITVEPAEFCEGSRSFESCKILRYGGVQRGNIVYWQLASDFKIALQQTRRYARLHIDTVKELNSFAAVRLYTKFCAILHAEKKRQWKPTINEMMQFVGCEGARFDNFRRRVLEPAAEEIALTRAFDGAHCFEYELIPNSTGSGSKVSFVHFYFGGGFRGGGWGRPVARNADGVPLEKLRPGGKRLTWKREQAKWRAEREIEWEIEDAKRKAAMAELVEIENVLGQDLARGIMGPGLRGKPTREQIDACNAAALEDRILYVKRRGEAYFTAILNWAEKMDDEAHDPARSEKDRASAKKLADGLYATHTAALAAAVRNKNWKPRSADLRDIDPSTGELIPRQSRAKGYAALNTVRIGSRRPAPIPPRDIRIPPESLGRVGSPPVGEGPDPVTQPTWLKKKKKPDEGQTA